MREHRIRSRPPLALLLWNTGVGIARMFDDYMARAGGTRPQLYVFLALYENPDASQREIADAVGVDGATITHHLSAMERQGLIVRERSERDRRIQRVRVTAAGETLYDNLVRAVDAYNEELFRGMSQSERSALRSTLERLAERATDYRPPSGAEPTD